MAHLSHAYPDGCSIYFTFAGSAATDAECLARYDAAWKGALDAAVTAGGTISHHHGVGRSKAPRLPAELGAGVDLVRAAMRAFDPRGVMNPGNLLPEDGPRTVGPPSTGVALAIDETSLLATVPGAMTLAALDAALAERGLELPLDAQTSRAERVDAWIAGGCAGAPDPWSDPVDHVIAGLRADLPSGARLDVIPSPRRAAGPDLVSLFVGTKSVMGTVVAADLRVRRAREPVARSLPYATDRNPAVTAGEQSLLRRLEEEIRR